MNDRRKKIETDINADWAAGRFTSAFEKISDDLCPLLRAALQAKRRNQQDAEDIVASAMHGFAKKLQKDGPASIAKPCNYLQAAVTNCLRILVSKTKKLPLARRDERDERQITDSVATQPTVNHRKVFLIQAVTETEDIPESDAKKLVAAVLKQMRPIYQRIMRDLLKHGPHWTLADAASRIGIKPGTYAVQKTRAFAAFKELAIPTANELGIEWRGLDEDTPAGGANYLDDDQGGEDDYDDDEPEEGEDDQSHEEQPVDDADE